MGSRNVSLVSLHWKQGHMTRRPLVPQKRETVGHRGDTGQSVTKQQPVNLHSQCGPLPRGEEAVTGQDPAVGRQRRRSVVESRGRVFVC